MSSYRLGLEPCSMDWKDVTSSSTSFPHIGTPSRGMLESKTPSRTQRNASLLSTTTSRMADVQAPSTFYCSILQKLSDVASQGNFVETRRPRRDLEVSLPIDVTTFLERQRHDCTESLLEAERAFGKAVQERSQQAAQLRDSEKFTFHTLEDLSAVTTRGLADMLRKQRDRREELKNFSKTDPSLVVGDRSMTEEEIVFSRTLRECNEAILCHQEVKIAEKFTDLVQDGSAHQLWRAFSAMTSIPVRKSREGNLLESTEKYRSSKAFLEGVMTRARRYLEQTAYGAALCRSGSTKPSDVVQLYTNSHLARQKFSKILPTGQQSVWAFIYYSLRLGQIEAALEFAEREDSVAPDLHSHLLEYEKCKGWLSEACRVDVEKIYRRLGAASNENVYQRAVYALLSRVETSDTFQGVTLTVSDWLWMKLSQINQSGKGFTLLKLQEMVREKFGSNADDAECFLVFILTGQFEQAIEELFANAKYRIHALHMAVALHHSGLLLTSNEEKPQENSPGGQLDFVALIKSYVRQFRRQNVEVAVEYYYQLLDFPVVAADLYDQQFRNMFELCLFKLAKDSQGVAKVFGKFEGEDADARLTRPLVHKFIADPQALMLTIATHFETEQRFEEALALLEIAGEKRSLLQALLRILSTILILPVEDTKRRNVYAVATACAKRLVQNGGKENLLVQNMYLLLDLMSFFDAYDQKHYRQAILIIKQLGIVPVEADKISQALENYRLFLLTDVRRCLPEICLYTMRALVLWFGLEKDKVRGVRVLARSALEYMSTSQLDSTISVGDDVPQLQEMFRQQCRPILEFAKALPAPQFPQLLENLSKLESSIY